MAQQTINVGAAPNDGTGTPLRTAFQYTNSNFTELYTAVGPSGNNIVVPGTATITGDLTVDTNVLKVNTTTNRVGINTTTPTQNLQITGSGDPLTVDGCSAIKLTNTVSGRAAIVGIDDSQNFVIWNVGTEVSETIKFLTGGGSGKEQYRITHGGVFNWYNGAGGTRMTLDSTGLGIGAGPSYKLDVTDNSTNIQARLNSSNNNGTSLRFVNTGTSGRTWQIGTGFAVTAGHFEIYDATAAVNRLSIDTSGNVGIGVTPSAWTSSDRALQFAYGNSIATATSTNFSIARNAQELAGGWTYSANGFVQLYNLESDGAYKWYTAASGTAGNVVSFGSAKMTLDTSGNLLLGTTNTSASAGVGFKANYSATVPAFSVVVNDAAGTGAAYTLYNTNAAAYRFYVSNGGTIFATNTTISAISDARLKENVQNLDVGLNEILALKPRKFDWKEGKGKNIKGDRGFIAQEFETVFPNLIDEWKDEAPEGEAPYKSVRQDLIPVLVKAIQELTARVQTLETR